MRVRRAQQLDVQQAVDRDVEREARLAGDDIGPGGRRHAVAARRSRPGASSMLRLPRDRILDGAIAGAAAEIALQRARQILRAAPG